MDNNTQYITRMYCKGMTQQEYNAHYRAKNRETLKAKDARYYLENKGKIKDRVKEYTKNNLEQVKKTQARWKAANPERMKHLSRRWLDQNMNKPEFKMKRRANWSDWNHRATYGITRQERAKLFESQGKRCRICRSDSSGSKGFHLDHCHSTNRIRGILCNRCNMMLGGAKDTIAILEAGIAYLKESR